MLILLLSLLLLPQQPPSPETRVREFVQAFNARGLDAMLALTTDDVQWLSIDKAGMTIEAEGKDALRKSMTSYFAQCPTCRSEIVWIRDAGSRVVALERASWTARAGKVSQSSLSVYEFTDGRIVRVYYFPAERDASLK